MQANIKHNELHDSLISRREIVIAGEISNWREIIVSMLGYW